MDAVFQKPSFITTDGKSMVQFCNRHFATAFLPRYHHRYWQWLIGLLLMILVWVIPFAALAANQLQPSQLQIQRLDRYIQTAITHAKATDIQESAAAFEQYRDAWFEVEDGVKEVSRQAYKEIEDAMGEVKFALSNQPPVQREVVNALQQLHALNQKFIDGGYSQQPATTPQTHKVTIATLLNQLNQASTALDQGNVTIAAQQIDRFKTDWLEVEGVVAAKSGEAYTRIENTMAAASGALRSNPPKLTAAKDAIAALQQDLQPYASSSLRYTMVDAAVILLREGLEALLVLVALLAFLSKSGNGDKQRWLWIGAGIGILASISTALVINLAFANLASGANRELLEGVVGLAAAAMLFYVSYWLHSKSSLMAWQGYIRDQITTALATNSIFSLALLAFLAVYREGAETTLFYIGIAPSISPSDLLLGLGLGTLALVVIAVLMLVLEMKVPLKPFFLVTSLLIYYLGFKFVGTGIHALQVAGVLQATPSSLLPALEGWGLYPTWETTLPQVALIIGAIAAVLYTRQKASSSTTGSLSSD
jgi:high-affinity iron transporter